MVQIVEQLMGMHVKALKDLGVDLEKAAKAGAKKKAVKKKAKRRWFLKMFLSKKEIKKLNEEISSEFEHYSSEVISNACL